MWCYQPLLLNQHDLLIIKEKIKKNNTLSYWNKTFNSIFQKWNPSIYVLTYFDKEFDKKKKKKKEDKIGHEFDIGIIFGKM